jgi:mono/diheme cytochrome c family protein
MRGRSFNTFAIAAFSVLILTACEADDAERPATDADRPAPEAPADPTPPADLPEGVTAESWQEGRRLFTGQGGCAACHGPQATGIANLGPNLTDDEWLNVEEPTMDEIMRVIREGVSQPVAHPAPMPPMGGARLTDDQVHALAAYIVAIN